MPTCPRPDCGAMLIEIERFPLGGQLLDPWFKCSGCNREFDQDGKPVIRENREILKFHNSQVQDDKKEGAAMPYVDREKRLQHMKDFHEKRKKAVEELAAMKRAVKHQQNIPQNIHREEETEQIQGGGEVSAKLTDQQREERKKKNREYQREWWQKNRSVAARTEAGPNGGGTPDKAEAERVAKPAGDAEAERRRKKTERQRRCRANKVKRSEKPAPGIPVAAQPAGISEMLSRKLEMLAEQAKVIYYTAKVLEEVGCKVDLPRPEEIFKA